MGSFLKNSKLHQFPRPQANSGINFISKSQYQDQNNTSEKQRFKTDP